MFFNYKLHCIYFNVIVININFFLVLIAWGMRESSLLNKIFTVVNLLTVTIVVVSGLFKSTYHLICFGDEKKNIVFKIIVYSLQYIVNKNNYNYLTFLG